jgi:hypothetical protein
MIVIVPIFIIFVVVSMIVSATQKEAHHEELRRFAEQNGCQVDQIEQPWFDHGPFWYRGKGQRLYRCRMRDAHGNDRTAYMRTGFFSNDIRFHDK